MKASILILADDAQLRAQLAGWLMVAGYAVELAESPKRAREVIANTDIALIMAAPNRMGISRMDLARELGGRDEQVLIIEEQTDEAGTPTKAPVRANGYIARPLSAQDVLGQVRSALGAMPFRKERIGPQLISFEGYTLDAEGRTCIDARGQEVMLTRAEFSLLFAFARQPGRVLSRDDLSHVVAGRGAEPDDRSVDVLMSRLRRKIEPEPKAPRIIVTVPGEGYKFTAKSQAVLPVEPAAAAPSIAVVSMEARAEDAKAFRSFPSRMAAIGAAVAALASIAGVAIVLWYAGFVTIKGALPSTVAAEKFDAAVIPLVNNMTRRELASYPARPDFKALAISAATSGGWGVAFGAPDAEAATRESLERCAARSFPKICRIYAVGEHVVWSPASLPLPAPTDLHVEPLDTPLTANEIPTLSDAMRREIAEKYLPRSGHKALAIANHSFFWNAAVDRDEAVRLAIERCGDSVQMPCLLLSVDGWLTTQIPKSRQIESIFMLSTEREMTETDRQRIAQIYAGKDWRALAKSDSGDWYAVAGHETEVAAVDEVLKACRQAKQECSLYAIGNWRVGEKIEARAG